MSPDKRVIREFDSAVLMESLNRIPESAWSLPSTYANTRVHHGYRRCDLVTAGRRQTGIPATGFDDILAEFAPVFKAWLSWIEPGGFITPHADAGPWRERWQIPIRVSGEMSGADERWITATVGIPFSVRHWERHAVRNFGDGPRIHLVLDRDRYVDDAPESRPFRLYPLTDEMFTMIEESHATR